MLEGESRREFLLLIMKGANIDEGPTYKVVLRGNATFPLVFDEMFGSELHKLPDLVLSKVPTF